MSLMTVKRSLYIALLVAIVSACVAPTACTRARSPEGTSVVVLIDFSKSFAPLTVSDARALNEVASAIVELAAKSWSPPVRFRWARIEEASVTAKNLCGPLEFESKLIKSDNDLDRAGLRQKLAECASTVLRASQDTSQQSSFTDISGAIALAAQDRENTGEKILVIFSDFLEDQRAGLQPVDFQLHGERVLLIHRPGLDLRGLTVGEYMARIDEWAGKLRLRGAKEVTSIPVFGITEHRVANALAPPAKPDGTAVSIVTSLPDTAEADVLLHVARAISASSPKWIAPVTVTWSAIEQSALVARWMPPVELQSRLIKRMGLLSPADEFAIQLEQCARGIARFPPTVEAADLPGALALHRQVAALDSRRLLLVLSDFRGALVDGAAPVDLSGTEIAMIAAPSRSDTAHQQNYFQRLKLWEQAFRECGARVVCRIQMSDLTAGAISRCL